MFDTFERESDFKERKLLQCNECRRQTIHTLEARCIGKWEREERRMHLYSGTEFSLFRCGACDEVCFEKSSWFSEDYDHDDDGNTYLNRTEVQYPPPSSAEFAFATEFTPSDLNHLIDEMLYALAGSKLRLATVAIRMVIEFIVTDKECSGQSLYLKIEDLHAKGHVDTTQLDLLHKIREKGNAGAHERIPMNLNEMVAGIGIVNLLLEKLYNGPARHEAAIKQATQAFKKEDPASDGSLKTSTE